MRKPHRKAFRARSKQFTEFLFEWKSEKGQARIRPQPNDFQALTVVNTQKYLFE